MIQRPLPVSILKLFLQRPWLAKQEQGWTLIEVITVVLMVGILAAIATPSMMTAKGNSDLKDALSAVKGTIQEAQRIAIKKGQTCTVTLSSSGVTGTPTGCVPSALTLGTGITLSQNSGTTIVFSYRGTTTSTKTVVLSSTNTSELKCLTVSNGLGILRTGYYTGTPFTGSCISSLKR